MTKETRRDETQTPRLAASEGDTWGLSPDGLPVACFLVNADGQLLKTNVRGRHLLGLPPGNAPLPHLADLLTPDTLPLLQTCLAETLAGPRNTDTDTRSEIRLKPAQNQPERTLQIHVAPDASGCACHLVASDMTACRHAETLMREKLDLLTDLSANLPGILFQYRLDTDGTTHFTYISRAIQAMYGINEDQAAQDAGTLGQHVHPEDQKALVTSMLRSATTLQPWRHEYRMRLKSGEMIWRALEAWPEKLPTGAILWHGHTIDITRRKLIENILRQNEERWKFALEGIGDGVWDWDVENNRILYSARWKEMLGYDEDEISDSPEEWTSRVHPDDAPLTEANGLRLTDGNTSSTAIEVRLRTKNGQWKWILSRGSVVTRDHAGKTLRVVGTNADITDRKQFETALQENEERWTLALEGAGHGVWDWNMQTGLTLFSKRWKAILGHAENEIGNTADEWLSRIHPDDMPYVEESMNRVLAMPARGSESIEFRMRCKDGHWRWMLGSGLLVGRNAEGKPLRMVGTLNDISGRKQIEEELRLTLSELDHRRREAEQLAATKSHFLNAASHDLRQPLYATQLFAGALADTPLAPAQRELLDNLQLSVQAMSAQLESLLDVSRLDMGKLLPQHHDISLEAIFQNLAATYAPVAARAGVSLLFRPASHLVHTDPVLVGRLLGNLIDNALKFTHPHRGNVLVCARRDTRDAPGGGLRIEVRDNGPGIDDEHQRRIFDEYYQAGNPARNPGEGLGLGLAIVQRIARLLDLPLGLRTRSGQGTTFFITLPLAGAGAGTGAAPDQ